MGPARRNVDGFQRHRPIQVCRISDEGQTTVIGDVQPLVRVGGPGVGLIDTGHQVRQRRTGDEQDRATTRSLRLLWISWTCKSCAYLLHTLHSG